VNQYGCLSTIQRTLNFYDFAVASYTLPESVTCLGNELTFNSTSTNSSSVEWLFGNSESVFGTTVDYEYPAAGTYSVTMIAYGGGGCNDTLTITPTITINPTPVADFNYENVIEINQWTGLVDFFNLSTFASNYQWYFGDGGSGTTVNPSHSYNTHGDFNVTLIAYNNFGCSDTIIKPIVVELYKGLYLANAMYPGHSDYNVSHFVPIGVGLKEFELLIFDDWGNLIWSTNALDANGRPTEAWDGTFNGAPVQQDAYVWKVNAVFLDDSLWEGKEYAKNKIKKSGTVTVIR
jgi:PKD repeat protein